LRTNDERSGKYSSITSCNTKACSATINQCHVVAQ
jgi:hypothetical protein